MPKPSRGASLLPRFTASWPHRGWRTALGFAVGLPLLLLFAYAVALWQVPRMAPRIRTQLAALLAAQLQSPVSVGQVHTRFDGALQVHVDGLGIQTVLRGIPGDPLHPMVRVHTLDLRMSLWQAMLGHVSIAEAVAHGIDAQLPPTAVGPSAHDDAATGTMHLERIVLEDAHVTFLTGDATRAPLRFDIPRAVLTGLEHNRPFHFDATVDNGAPVGTVQTSGTMGPWNTDDPRNTPLQGTLAFAHRDMGSVRGLSGSLSMQAGYRGTLGTLQAAGETDDPAFRLDISARPMLLRTRFRMTVDAVHGIVRMDAIDARLLGTQFTANGTVTKDPATSGYVLDLSLDVPDGRVEDALTLAATAQPTVLHGALRLQGRLQMEAGDRAVAQKLHLVDGRFRLVGVRFGRVDVQRSADALSERASGDPAHAHADDAAPSSAQATGRLRLDRGVAHLEGVHLVAPGAAIDVAGTYTLGGTGFFMRGTLHTAATASQMHTGLKRVLLRPLDNMFSHGGGGATFPLEVTGAGNLPRFRVTLPGGAKMTALD